MSDKRYPVTLHSRGGVTVYAKSPAHQTYLRLMDKIASSHPSGRRKRSVNYVDFGSHGGTPPRPTAPKPALTRAINRLLGR